MCLLQKKWKKRIQILQKNNIIFIHILFSLFSNFFLPRVAYINTSTRLSTPPSSHILNSANKSRLAISTSTGRMSWKTLHCAAPSGSNCALGNIKEKAGDQSIIFLAENFCLPCLESLESESGWSKYAYVFTEVDYLIFLI